MIEGKKAEYGSWDAGVVGTSRLVRTRTFCLSLRIYFSHLACIWYSVKSTIDYVRNIYYYCNNVFNWNRERDTAEQMGYCYSFSARTTHRNDRTQENTSIPLWVPLPTSNRVSREEEEQHKQKQTPNDLFT